MERIHMREIMDIINRLRSGESERAISEDLGHSRVTVNRYRQLAEDKGFLNPAVALPQPSEVLEALGPPHKTPKVPSTVLPFQELVTGWDKDGVEMVAMYQRLVENHGYSGSYSSIRRFLANKHRANPEVWVRVETGPGEEVQIDFGYAGMMKDPATQQMRKAWCFVMVMCHSRHQYVEFVFNQTIAMWVGCHIRAFKWFGGLPKRVVIDNLKSAVIKSLLEDPVFSAPYRDMALHYGFLIRPCRPRTPRHKGKVESGVSYVKNNFISAQTFVDIGDANRRVAKWVLEYAGLRKHGTTAQQPLERFRAVEKSALLPLPLHPFTLEEVREAKVGRDCHVTVGGNYYSVPFTLVGKSLEVHLYPGTVQIYDGIELICTHERAKSKGERFTRGEHYPLEKRRFLEHTPDYCRAAAKEVGPYCYELICGILDVRPADNLSAAQQTIALVEKLTGARVEAACCRAIYFGDPHYRRVKSILAAGTDTDPLPEQPLPATENEKPVYAHARLVSEFFPEAMPIC
jgi:transposase